MLVQELGFVQGTSCANVFRHGERSIQISVHGDDFQCLGGKRALDWLETEIKKQYECTVQPRLGPGPNDAKTGLVLNRVIHWNENSLSYEADPRQLERLVTECGLDGAKPVSTPGAKPAAAELCACAGTVTPRRTSATDSATCDASEAATFESYQQGAGSEQSQPSRSRCRAATQAPVGPRGVDDAASAGTSGSGLLVLASALPLLRIDLL